MYVMRFRLVFGEPFFTEIPEKGEFSSLAFHAKYHGCWVVWRKLETISVSANRGNVRGV